MPDANYYKIGEHNVTCDICQRKRKRSDCQPTWDSYMACRDTCYDPRHPSTVPLPVVIDGLPVKDARPRPNSIYITYDGQNSWTSQKNLSGNYGDYTWDGADFYWNDGSTQFDSADDYDPDIFWPLG